MKIARRPQILLFIAGAIGIYVLWGPADSQTVESARRADGTPAAHIPTAARPAAKDHSRELYRLAHRVIDGTSVDSLFAAHAWFSPPPPPPAPIITASEAAAAAAAEAAARVPTAPPLPFAFIGSYTPDGSDPVFFLTQGDRVFDVRVGDTLENTYSVDALNNGQLVMTYKPLNIKQQLQVGSSQ
jgi:hypothetical protein